MKYILYLIAILFILFWAVGFFIYSIGAIIHLLLIVAVGTVLYNAYRIEKNRKQESSRR